MAEDGADDQCLLCKHKVYPIDSVQVTEYEVVHKKCFKCKTCNTGLLPGHFQKVEEDYYCSRHAAEAEKAKFDASKAQYAGAARDMDVEGLDKCALCGKSVFPIDAWPLTDSDVIHKTCLKCDTCSMSLKPGAFVKVGDSYYCERHAVEAQKTLDAEHRAQFAGGDLDLEGGDKCAFCNKTVLAMDKHSLVADNLILHKGCFKCFECSVSLTLGTMSKHANKYYCQQHAEEAERVALEALKHEKAGAELDLEGGDKCAMCTKTVFPLDKFSIDPSVVIHKGCFRCKTCDCTLSQTSAVLHHSTYYCKQHAAAVNQAEQDEHRYKFAAADGDTEGGEKCDVCSRTMFALDKLKLGDVTIHKGCSRCKTCKCMLTLASVVVRGPDLYCRTHAEEADKEEAEARRGKFSGQVSGGKTCLVCSKSVLPMEELKLDAGSFIHKLCFRCCECQLPLNLSLYVGVNDKLYCKNHGAEAQKASLK